MSDFFRRRTNFGFFPLAYRGSSFPFSLDEPILLVCRCLLSVIHLNEKRTFKQNYFWMEKIPDLSTQSTSNKPWNINVWFKMEQIYSTRNTYMKCKKHTYVVVYAYTGNSASRNFDVSTCQLLLCLLFQEELMYDAHWWRKQLAS